MIGLVVAGIVLLLLCGALFAADIADPWHTYRPDWKTVFVAAAAGAVAQGISLLL